MHICDWTNHFSRKKTGMYGQNLTTFTLTSVNCSLQNISTATPFNQSTVVNIDATKLLSWIVTTCLVCFVGTLANVLAILAIWPRQPFTSGLNFLIFHFLAVNLFMCLVNIPICIGMIAARQSGYIISPISCNYVQPLYTIFYWLANWFEAGLAVNRYIALFFPHSYKVCVKPRRWQNLS